MEILIYPVILPFINEITGKFHEIPEPRASMLNKGSEYIRIQRHKNKVVNLLFVCTHNSRRSQFGEIAATLAAAYYNLPKLNSYSAGTEITAFHPNAINALNETGFQINSNKSSVINPVYSVKFGEHFVNNCYSKHINDPIIPKENLLAIYTCSEVETACPVIVGAQSHLSLPYPDPKISDGSGHELETYGNTFRNICLEIFYMLSKV